MSDPMEETKVRHERYLRAINSPIRREILMLIKKGNRNTNTLSKALGLDVKILEWHLNMLIHGYCIEEKKTSEGTHYEITQEGLVVDFMDK